jgi:hypothetical protein
MRGRQGKQIFLASKKISSPCHTRIARENRSQVQAIAMPVLPRRSNSGFVGDGESHSQNVLIFNVSGGLSLVG